MVYLHLFLFVNVNVNYQVIFLVDIVTLHNVDISILEPFVIEVVLDYQFGTIDHVRCYLITADNANLLFQVITL